MKKSSLKKTLLTSTMAFALAMGTAMPAFADQLDNGDKGTIVGDQASVANPEHQYTDQEYVPNAQGVLSDVKTEVGVFSRMGQIKVSVPTKVALALTAAGGKVAGPDARTIASTTDQVDDGSGAALKRMGSGYGIENLGGMPVKVTGVAAAITTDFAWPTASTAAANSTTATSQGKISNLFLTMTPKFDASSGSSGTGITKLAASNNVTWTIGRATEQGTSITPTVFGIAIEGTNSPIAKSVGSSAVETTKAMDITYTIGV